MTIPTALLIVLGVFAAVLMYLTGARYARSLHERVQNLEVVIAANQIENRERIRENNVIVEMNQRIFEELFGEDDEDDAVIH